MTKSLSLDQWVEGISVRVAHPVSTPRGKLMMPPADRIHSDPGQGARKVPSDTADLNFQAVGPALRILQLNVEGLSAAKRSIIQTLAKRHHIWNCIRQQQLDQSLILARQLEWNVWRYNAAVWHVPRHGSFLTRNSSSAIHPPPTLTITVLRKILTRRIFWDSPNYNQMQ